MHNGAQTLISDTKRPVEFEIEMDHKSNIEKSRYLQKFLSEPNIEAGVVGFLQLVALWSQAVHSIRELACLLCDFMGYNSFATYLYRIYYKN